MTKIDKATSRPMGYTALMAHLDSGSTIRRGTAMGGAFPCWQWQVFDIWGRLIGPVNWRAVNRAVNERGEVIISAQAGANL